MPLFVSVVCNNLTLVVQSERSIGRLCSARHTFHTLTQRESPTGRPGVLHLLHWNQIFEHDDFCVLVANDKYKHEEGVMLSVCIFR